MALKSKIDKAAFDALPDVLKAEYKEHNGAYVLDTDDGDELRRTVETLRGETKTQERARKAAEKKAEELEEKLAQAALEQTKPEDLKAAYENKAKELEAKYKAEVAARDTREGNQAVKGAASVIAAKISKRPGLLLPHIQERLAYEIGTDGEIAVKVKDKDGKIGIASLDDLEKEMVANEEYSDIIIGSRASGGAGKQQPGRQQAQTTPNNPNQQQQPGLLSAQKGQGLVASIKERAASRANTTGG